MKKVILLFATALLGLISCTKEEGSSNPYAGTKWSKSYYSSFSDENYMYVIEFTETDFSYYEADINGGYKSGMTQGKYTYSGNEITINNVKDNTSILGEYITGATVAGNVLTLHTYWIASNGKRYGEVMVMVKRNNI